MSHPLTGMSEDDQSLRISNGMAFAKKTRSRWLASLVSGEVTLKTVIDVSQTQSDEGRALTALRLSDILKARPGWTSATALDTLQRHGFTAENTIQSIRTKRARADRFEQILLSTADRWRARPDPPAGWPWYGKLSALVVASGESLPDELAALMDVTEDGEEDVLAVEDQSDPLAELIGDDDDG